MSLKSQWAVKKGSTLVLIKRLTVSIRLCELQARIKVGELGPYDKDGCLKEDCERA